MVRAGGEAGETVVGAANAVGLGDALVEGEGLVVGSLAASWSERVRAVRMEASMLGSSGSRRATAPSAAAVPMASPRVSVTVR